MSRPVILGGAPCLWDDLTDLESLVGGPWPGPVVAVNDVGVHYAGRVDLWCSLHPEKLAGSDPDHPDGLSWEQQRAEAGHPGGYTTVAPREPHLVHEVVEHWGGGSVAFYAMAACYRKGLPPGILCGCPLDDSGALPESTTSHTLSEHLDGYRRAWVRRLERGGPIAGYIRGWRSMGGWTAELLGTVDEAWWSSAYAGGRSG